MIRQLVRTIVIGLNAVWLASAHAKPMDAEAANRLPELKSIVETVKSKTLLSKTQVAFIRKCLQTEEPVLVSVAAWCVMRANVDDSQLQADLDQFTPSKGDMPYAFVAIAKETLATRKMSTSEKIVRLRALSKSDNPFLKLEAVKAIAQLDDKEGKRLLTALAQDSNGTSAVEASRLLKEIGASPESGPSASQPYISEQYEMVLATIGGANH